MLLEGGSVSLSSGGGISLPCKPPLSRTSMGSSRISAQGSLSGSCNVGCQLLTWRARESQASGSYGGAIWGRNRQVLQEAELGITSPTGRRRWPFLLLVPAALLPGNPESTGSSQGCHSLCISKVTGLLLNNDFEKNLLDQIRVPKYLQIVKGIQI